MSLQFNTRWEARGRTILSASDPVPKVMGIVNLTPDSFSDGGRLAESVSNRSSFAKRLAGQGADLLDLGGESSRPGAEPVSLEEEAESRHPRPSNALAINSRSRSRLTRPRPKSPALPWPPGPRSSTTSARSAADPEMAARGGKLRGRRRPHAHARHARHHAGQPALSRTS